MALRLIEPIRASARQTIARASPGRDGRQFRRKAIKAEGCHEIPDRRLDRFGFDHNLGGPLRCRVLRPRAVTVGIAAGSSTTLTI